MKMQSPTKTQTATHCFLALGNQKAGAIAGAGVSGFGQRQRPNPALNPDARTCGFGLRWRGHSRRLALRWAARFERLIASISEFFTLRKGIENDHKTK